MNKAGPKLIRMKLPLGAEATRYAVCEYIGELSKELAGFAFNNGFDSLAIIFEMARQDAERILRASDEHLSRS
jgi:hypothetical protein